MNKTRMTIYCAALIAMLSIGTTLCEADENLGNVLSESGWDRIIGTWVDAETRGTKSTTTYAWKFKNRVIEVMSQNGKRETVSLIGRNPKTGEVFNISANNKGGSSLGKWTLEEGKAILDLLFVTGEGVEGALRIRFRLKDDNTMIVTIDLPEPITVKMIRKKSKARKK